MNNTYYASAFYSYSLLGNNIHFIHRDRNRLDHKPINSVLQLVGVQHVNFTNRPSVIHVWLKMQSVTFSWTFWNVTFNILVQCLTCCPFPAFEELGKHKGGLNQLNCMLGGISCQKCDIYFHFITFNILHKITKMNIQNITLNL